MYWGKEEELVVFIYPRGIKGHTKEETGKSYHPVDQGPVWKWNKYECSNLFLIEQKLNHSESSDQVFNQVNLTTFFQFFHQKRFRV